jgi:hypothetical protein
MMRMVYIGDNPVLNGKIALVQALESTVVENEAGIERVTKELSTLPGNDTVEAQFDDFTSVAVKPWAIGWHNFTRREFEVPPCQPNDHHWSTEHTADGEKCQCGSVSFPPVR